MNNIIIGSITIWSEYGYVKLEEVYESGWYEKHDNPKIIAQKLREKQIEKFLFQIKEVEQFRTTWVVWVHASEIEYMSDI